MTSSAQDKILRGPKCSVPLPDGLARYINDKLRQHGDKVAVVYPQQGGAQQTFSQLRRESGAVAAQLRRLGLRPGDVLAAATDGGPSYAPLLLACLSTGVVIAPFNPAFDDDETRHVLGFLRPRVLIADSPNPLYEKLAPLVVSGEEVASWLADAGDQGADPEAEAEDPPSLDAPAAILCSSGTTGYPKGVEVSHRALLHLLAVANEQQTMMGNDGTFLLPSPAFWISVTMMLLLSINAGSKVLLIGNYEEKLFLKVLREHQVFGTIMSPYVGVRLCKMDPPPDLTPLRIVVFGGSPIDRSTLLALHAKFGVAPMQAYGMTEVLITLGGTRESPAPIGSVGRAQHDMEVKVVNPESGAALGPGEDGELCFRGPTVTRGYYNDPEATAAAFDAEGWFHTGDIGHYDETGLFFITDRIKDFIKYKGHHVPSAQLETTLLKHPAVLEAAVVGVPNPETVELPRAYVVLKAGAQVSAEELASFVNSEVSDHKKLRGGVIFLDKLPRTATGKTCKRILRQQAQKDVDKK